MSRYPRCQDMKAVGMGVTLCRDSAEPRLDGSDPGEGGGLTIVCLAHSPAALLTLHAGPFTHSDVISSSLPRPLESTTHYLPMTIKCPALRSKPQEQVVQSPSRP